MCSNSFAICIEQDPTSSGPCNCGGRIERSDAQSFQEGGVFVEHCDVLRECIDISYAVHKSGLHMAANFGACLGSQWNTSAAHSFCDYQTEPFFNTWKHQYVAVPHQFRHIVPVTQHLHAGMRKHGCQFFLIGGQKSSGNEKRAVF